MNAFTQSLKRLGNLGRLFAVTQGRSVLINLAAAAAVLLAAYIIAVFSGGTTGTFAFHEVFFPIFFLVAGFISTSNSFSPMHKADRSYAYLTLPASHLEKTLEKLLLTTVAYIIVALVGYFAFSGVALGVSEVIAGRSFPIFNPFAAWVWELVRFYVIVQSIFLFGGAYFRNKYFIKTLLGVAAVFLVVGAVASGATWLFFGDIFRALREGTIDTFQNVTVGQAETFQRIAMIVRTVAEVLFYWIMAPLFWVMTWLRIREAEVSDAV
ncbi:MAG: hypothetical protein ACOCYC_01815 [bacterium]